jgi:hypothetical protein
MNAHLFNMHPNMFLFASKHGDTVILSTIKALVVLAHLSKMKIVNLTLLQAVSNLAFAAPSNPKNQTTKIENIARASYLTECNMGGIQRVYDIELWQSEMHRCIGAYDSSKCSPGHFFLGVTNMCILILTVNRDMNQIYCHDKWWNTGFVLLAEKDTMKYCRGICHDCIRRAIGSQMAEAHCKIHTNQESYCYASYE